MNDRTKVLLERLFSLEGKRGIVTGASSGIGLGIARVLADAGAVVYNFSRSACEQESYPGIIPVSVDITDDAALDQAVKQVALEGSIDFLVNNAGITKRTRAEAVSRELWEQIHNVDVAALFHLCQLCYPYLKEAPGSGRIVNIASMASYMGFAEVVPYCSAKSAVRGITTGLATEWVDDHILVNSISPGWFPSKMNQQVMDADRKAKILGKIPMGRFGDVEDIGAMVLYLISPAANYVTGQDFVVDGGAQTFGF